MSPAPILACVVLSALLADPLAGEDQEALDMERYVAMVLRSHPASAQSAGLETAAAAERKAARLFPDPVFAYSHDHATTSDVGGVSTAEHGYSVSQSIPWPGTFAAGVRAGDRASDVLRADAAALRWDLASEAKKAFARLVAARALFDVARAAEEDARALRDLVSRRVDLGESREADRIKATVEWLRQQRSLAAAERQAESAEMVVRALAVEALPRPLSVTPAALPPMPPLDRDAAVAETVARNPRLAAARAESARRGAVLSVARRGRMPDLDAAFFRNEELDKRATGFSLGLKIPLWNANRGEIARAEASAAIAGAEADRARIDLVTDLEGRLKDLRIAAAQAALLNGDLLPAATQSVGLARFSFEEGETSLLDLLDAQRTYRDTEREAAEARLAVSLALADVQALAGPGFDPWRPR